VAVNGGGGRFHAWMLPAQEITITTTNSSTTQSAAAYVYRTDDDFIMSSLLDETKVYLYHNSYTKDFNIPTSAQPRNIKTYIPVSELNQDSRKVEMTVTAGPISKTVYAYTENLGESLRLFIIVLEDVPGTVNTLTVDIVSPNSDGDSFIAGNVLVDVPCPIAQGEEDYPEPPVAVDDSKTTAVGTPVDINVLANDYDPDNDIDYCSVIQLGLLDPEHGTITNISPYTGIITYEPEPGFIGTDTFEYMVFDETGLFSAALVTVNITQCGEGYVSYPSASGYASSVTASYINPSNDHGDMNTATNALAAPDGVNALIHWGGDYIILDLEDVVPSGEELEFTWRKRPGESGTASMVLSVSTDNNSYTSQTYPTTSSTTLTTSTVTLSADARYIRITKNNSVSGSDFEVDAVSYSNGNGCETDNDKDGVADIDDIDDDNDGILDIIEGEGTDPGADADGDDIVNYMDTDFPGFIDLNGDGIHDIFDSDFDGIPDYLDLDSDNDGILDNIEAQSTPDYIPNTNYTDIDKDGLLDIYDANLGGPSLSYGIEPYDKDGDLIPDFLDEDSDNDNVYDWIEAFDYQFIANANPEIEDRALVFYVKSGGSDKYLTNLDENNNGVPDFIDGCDIGQPSVVPAFLDPDCSFFFDTDNDGLIDLFDIDDFGIPQPQPILPEGTTDKAWRDIDTNGLLPVELLFFETKCEQGEALINWSTATETNNSYFTLEKSFNGKDFSSIAIIEGAGNSNILNEYVFVDTENLEKRSYYRLSQTDYDGTTKVFQIITGQCANSYNKEPNIIVYPNPFEKELHILVEHWSYSNSVDLTLIDTKGSVITNQNLKLYDGASHEIIPLPELAPGDYFLIIRNGAISKSIQLIKK
jgi:hypothetical protein